MAPRITLDLFDYNLLKSDSEKIEKIREYIKSIHHYLKVTDVYRTTDSKVYSGGIQYVDLPVSEMNDFIMRIIRECEKKPC